MPRRRELELQCSNVANNLVAMLQVGALAGKFLYSYTVYITCIILCDHWLILFPVQNAFSGGHHDSVTHAGVTIHKAASWHVYTGEGMAGLMWYVDFYPRVVGDLRIERALTIFISPLYFYSSVFAVYSTGSGCFTDSITTTIRSW